MTIARARTAGSLLAVLALPFLLAANGDGCNAQSVCAPLPCPSGAPWSQAACACVAQDAGAVSDAGDSSQDAGACVSGLGGGCGGNTAHPCVCATGLVCTPTNPSLPFGDVGGTCLAP